LFTRFEGYLRASFSATRKKNGAVIRAPSSKH